MYKCWKCKGSGFVASTICRACLGDGELDWIENVVGKGRPLITPEEIVKSWRPSAKVGVLVYDELDQLFKVVDLEEETTKGTITQGDEHYGKL